MPSTRSPKKSAKKPSTKRQRTLEVSNSSELPAPVHVVGGPVLIPVPRKSEKEKAPKTGKAPKSKGKKGAKKKGAKKQRKFTAKTADIQELYQLSVQSPEEDVKFLRRVYKRLRKREAKHFREDFCGTGLLMSHWIESVKDGTAEGFDICRETIGWGILNNFPRLGEKASRATLHVKDVRDPSLTPPDVRCAQNFSYFVFKERTELLEYFKSVHADLADDGVFVMDIYGGPESMEEMLEEREIEEGFTYIWDQDEYWPATGEYKTYIHFQFEDGTKLERAFSYDWRLWNLLEIQDALREAGFGSVETYWEGTDKDGESGNGVYRPSKKGENCLAWVTYVVAGK